jgi:hypothetical protein
MKQITVVFISLLALVGGLVVHQAAWPQSPPPASSLYLPLLSRDFKGEFLSPIMGLQMDWAIIEETGLNQAVESGSHWVRFDAFAWDLIEPSADTAPAYRWEAVDEISLRNAFQNGLKIIAVVKFIPPWAQKYAGSGCGPIKNEAFGKFAEFLTAIVSRYKNPPYNVKYWELMNEPDAPLWYARTAYGCWGDVNDPDYGGGYFAQMLKAAYPAIKAADPQAKVLIGGLLLDNPNEEPYNPARFLEGILRGGGGPFFDIVSFHGYGYYEGQRGYITNPLWPGSATTISEKAALIRRVLNRNGSSDKTLFNTEAALYCLEEIPDCLETQSMFVPRAFAEGIAAGLLGVTHYALKCEYRSLGLLYPDNTPRPSYRAFKTASAFLNKVRYQGPASGYPAGITGFSFFRNGPGHLDLIWSGNGAATPVTVPLGSTAYDRYGTNLATGGETIPVDYGPVYIQRP